MKTPTGFQELVFTNAGLADLYVQTSNSSEPKYYVETSSFKPGKPDLTVHTGNTTNGPVSGVCKVGHSMEKKIGLGDPSADLNAVQWESLKQHGRLVNLKYTFDMEIGPEGERKSFLWTRISRYPEHYKLFMDGNEIELLAEYSGTWLGRFGKGRERGKVVLARGKGERWELAVLLTILTMIEATRRRARRNM